MSLSVAEYRNMCGRAGRYGLTKDSYGRSFLIAKSGIDVPALMESYVKLPPEPLKSQLFQRPMADLLLKTLANSLCDTADGCYRFLKKTFAAMEFVRSPSDEQRVQNSIRQAIESLIRCELLATDKKAKLIVTPLGMICASSGLLVESFTPILDGVRKTKPTALDVAYMASQAVDAGAQACNLRFSTSEYDNRTTAYVQMLTQAEANEPSSLMAAFLASLAPGVRPSYETAHAMKYQCVAYMFAMGIASQEIESKLSASAGKARLIGSYCSWVADTAAKIAWSINRPDDAKAYERVSDRFTFGCTAAALLVASASRALHRAERESLVQAGYDSLTKIVQTKPVDIARTVRIDRVRVERLQKDIVELLGDSLGIEQRQSARMTAIGKPIKQLEELYAIKGTSLEQVIEEILTAPFCPIQVTRITPQREGEADIKIAFPKGYNGVAGVTAKESPTDKVGINKALAVMTQSPELKPKVFISIGRPDFLPDAIKKATEHAKNGFNIKLLPLHVLAEMYVLYHEGMLSSDQVVDILDSERGYINLQSLAAYVGRK
ncbi:MAG: hypothetical protein QM770_01330 [Tepidisphaeraceae bacterium]